MSPDLAAIGRRRYVALGTYRRSGARVATAVWIARSGDVLVVRTGAGSGKVKRLRNDSRITLQQCSGRGRVRAGAPLVEAEAEIVTDAEEQRRAFAALGAKYGLQWRIALLLQRSMTPVTLRVADRAA